VWLTIQEKCTVEPVIGIIKATLGFRQFSVRGLASVNGEWTLVCLAYNIKRLHTLLSGTVPAGVRAAQVAAALADAVHRWLAMLRWKRPRSFAQAAAALAGLCTAVVRWTISSCLCELSPTGC
jgi:hypothetical protein